MERTRFEYRETVHTVFDVHRGLRDNVKKGLIATMSIVMVVMMMMMTTKTMTTMTRKVMVGIKIMMIKMKRMTTTISIIN